MLVKRFTFKRNHDKGGFPWTAHSEIERPGFYRGFTAVGKRLADVKEFAALVRRCAGAARPTDDGGFPGRHHLAHQPRQWARSRRIRS